MKTATIIFISIALLITGITVYKMTPKFPPQINGVTALSLESTQVIPTAVPTKEIAPTATPKSDIQVLKAIYSNAFGLQPKQLTAKAGIPIRLEVTSTDDGEGCMGSISLPQLSNDYFGFEKGKTVVFNVTPPGPGEYAITCAMGISHGSIIVE